MFPEPFGARKFLPAYSPAEELAGATIARLTFGLVEPKAAVPFLAAWETAIGAALVLGVPQLGDATLISRAGEIVPRPANACCCGRDCCGPM